MSSTFFGLNIGASALSTFQTAVNTTANNISNVQTEGYTKQTTNINATSALRVNQKYGSVGTGVEASSITQSRNEYYDTKYWENNSSYGLYNQKLYYLDQIQTILKDDSTQTGFSTIFANMFSALDSVISDGPADLSARNQFINKAQSLCTYFNSLYNSLQDIQTDCNEEIKNAANSINATSEKIALLNKEIYNIEVRGGHANELRDERNSLIDELSSMVNVETEEVEVHNTNGENLGATTCRVYINGQSLVDGFDYRTLECTSSEYSKNQCDVEGLYGLVWSDTKMEFAVTSGTSNGSLTALFQMRDGNNNEAMMGTVSTTYTANADDTISNGVITITDFDNTDVNALAIPAKGTMTIGSDTYTYNSWEAELDTDGNLVSISFTLSNDSNSRISPAKMAGMNGKTATIGENVDAMGVPYYMSQINQFLRTFAENFNQMEESGVTLDGDKMGAFFTATNIVGTTFDFSDQETVNSYDPTTKETDITYASKISSSTAGTSSSYYQLTAGTFEVNANSLKSARYFSTTLDVTNGQDAYDVITRLETLQKDVTMFRGDDAESFLETLLSDVSVDTNKSETFYNNYNNLNTSLDNQRTSVSGVDEDEEALDLIKFQNAYNMASKLISVMSEMYDKLIEETGVT